MSVRLPKPSQIKLSSHHKKQQRNSERIVTLAQILSLRGTTQVIKSLSVSDDSQAEKKHDIRETTAMNQRGQLGLDIGDTESQGSQIN